MNRSIVLILACIFVIPLAARPQNEGIKATSNPQIVEKPPMHPRSTQEMAMMQEKDAAGGGAKNPVDLLARDEGIYLEPGWAKGRVMLSDHIVMENIQLRYDIYHQQIQFIRDNDTLAFARPDEIKCFVLDGKNFIYADYQNDELISKGYFEVVSQGNCMLLLRRTIKYHIDPDTEPLLKNDIYIRECQYYISKNGETAKPVRTCRKSVLCAFKDKEKEVKDFMDDNNIKMNTCDQLKQVVAFYNTLP
jgi:hypothetical protein